MDYILTYDDELYHHGIKGMKWGVRRFQNYDGTYTKNGLERYNKADEKYQKAKQKQKEAKERLRSSVNNPRANMLDLKARYNRAKGEARDANFERHKAYKKLKEDYRADKGKELYAKGRTINGNKKRATAAMAAWYLGEFATYSLYSSGKLSGGATMNINRGIRAATALGLGKIAYDNRNLRSYYAHS